jgi:hypothetical protein
MENLTFELIDANVKLVFGGKKLWRGFGGTLLVSVEFFQNFCATKMLSKTLAWTIALSFLIFVQQ